MPLLETRPYLMRAIFQWCADEELTPHIMVVVDDCCQVPRSYVTDGQIVFNVSQTAVPDLYIGRHLIRFFAQFGGKPFDVVIPISAIVAVYARENGEGLALGEPELVWDNFEQLMAMEYGEHDAAQAKTAESLSAPEGEKKTSRAHLHIVK